MEASFEYCRSCGERTEIDPAVPEPERICRVCGGPCSGIEEWQPPVPARRGPPPGFDAEGHVPAELMPATCPHCDTDVAVDPSRSLAKQRCHACGRRLKEAKRKRVRVREEAVSPRRHRRRGRERIWMPMLGAAIAIVLGGCFLVWFRTKPEPAGASPEASGPPAPWQEITELIRRFNAAATPDELLPLIREPDKFEQSLRAWCAARPQGLPMRGELTGIHAPFTMLGITAAHPAVSFPGMAETLILTVQTPDGFRVDWRAFSGVGDLSIADFLDRRPLEPVLLMAVAHRSDYYNGPYADSSAWLCLRVVDGRGKNPFYAYLSRNNGALMKAVEDLPEADSRRDLDRAAVSRPLALRAGFRSPETAAALMAEIREIPGEGWYVP